MPITKSRQIAKLLKLDGTVKDSLYDSDAIVTSAQLGVAAAAGTTVYSSADTLPTSATNGDQALVSSTNRLYIYSNGGWYNIALINTTPYWSSEANSSYELSTTGAVTTITMLAVDSEGVPITYTATPDSDFNQFATVSKDSDNGRTFTVTPTDSENGTATNATGTITFKASDGVNLVSTLSTFSISFQVTNSNYTTLLLKADSDYTDNQIDASTIGRTITETGNVTSTAFTPYHPGGYSTYFDGTGDYISIAYNSNLDMTQTSTATIETWIYLPAAPDANKAIITNRPVSEAGEGMDLRLTSSRTIQYYETGQGSIVGSTVIPLNTWTHVAMVKTGGSVYIYINGTLDNSGSFSNGSAGSNPTFIGRTGGGGTDYINAYIRDLRVVNGTAVYTSSFTPPTESLTAITNTVLLACHLPYIADGSTSNQTFTVNGNTSTKRFGPYNYVGYSKTDYGGSLYFDGNGDLLTMASSADFNLGDEYTVEMWVYQEERDASEACRVYMAGNNGDTNGFCFSITSSGALDVGRPTGGGVISGSGGFIPLNTWNHLAVVKQGSTATGYINGNYVTHSGAATTQTSGNVAAKIGYDTVGTVSEQFKGYIQDLQVIKGRTKYPLATSSGRVFTPPISPYSADSDAVLLTCTNKNDIWDTSKGTVLTKAGNVTSSHIQRKFTTSSAIAFDGSGDSISITAGYDDPLYNFGTHDWTLEGWFYIQTLSSGRNLFSFLRASANEATPHVYSQGTDLRYYVLGADRIIGTSALTVNTWHHIAATRSGNDHKLFVDGTQVGSTWTNAQTYVQGRPVLGDYHTSLGNLTGGTNLLHGYVQNFRITKGLARYTSNFTPPTAEFDG